MIHPRNSNSNANSNSYSNFFIKLYLHREITLHVPFEWPHTLSACYRVSLYAWVYIRYWLACAYHLFQSFRRCFSINSTFCGFCNQGGGGIHKFVILDVYNNLCSSSLHRSWPYKCCCGPLIGWKVPATAGDCIESSTLLNFENYSRRLLTTVAHLRWRQSPAEV